MEALAAGLPFITCLGGVPGVLAVGGGESPVGPLAPVAPLVFLRLKMPIGTRVSVVTELCGKLLSTGCLQAIAYSIV